MFPKFLNSGENKLKFLIYIVLIVSVISLLLYADFSYRKSSNYKSEQNLYQIGKAYEYKIKSELGQYYAILELLSVSFSKNSDDADFTDESKIILQNLIESHDRIITVGYVYKTIDKQASNQLFNFSDSVAGKFLSFNRLKTRIDVEDNAGEFQNLQLKVEIEKAIAKGKTFVLSPFVKQVEGGEVPVIPVVSPVFKSRQLLGYLVLLVSVDWLNENEGLTTVSDEPYEAFVAAGNGKLIAIKDKQVLLSENIKKVCFSCGDLLGEKGSFFNSVIENQYLTLCLPVALPFGLENWDICLRTSKSAINGSFQYRLIIWLIGLFLLGAGIIVIHLLFRRILKPWDEIYHLADSIISGEYYEIDAKAMAGLKDEDFNKLKTTLTNISKSLDELTIHSKAAASGDFNKTVSVADFKNGIVSGLSTVIEQLKTTHDKLNKSIAETKQANQFIEGIDKISDVLKMYHKDLHELSEQVIRTLVDLMDVEMGAVFLLKSEGDEAWLELEVSYAYNENKYQKRKFKLGESLVGSCASEKRTVHLKKIPEDYLKIISGLGQTSPKSLLIIPLIFENEVLGVLELGTLKEFEQNNISFAEKAAETIANTLSLAENNIRNSQLLEKTQVQTKDLEESERKMKEALAELKEMQNKTAKSEAIVRAKLEAMNHTLMMVEYTTEGILLDANYKFLNTMQYSLDEIIGNNVIELLKEEDREDLLKVINTVKSGNYYEAIMRRHTKTGQEKWFMATYTPVFDDDGIVQNILFFGADITKIKMAEIEMKSKIQNTGPFI